MKIRVEVTRARHLPGWPVQVYSEAIVAGEPMCHTVTLECDEDGYVGASYWFGAMRQTWEAMQRAAQVKELPGFSVTPKPKREATEERGFV